MLRFQKCKHEQFLNLVFDSIAKCLCGFGQSYFVLVFVAADRCAEGSELLRGLVMDKELWARTCHLSMTLRPVTTKQVFKTINDTLNVSLNFQKQVYI